MIIFEFCKSKKIKSYVFNFFNDTHIFDYCLLNGLCTRMLIKKLNLVVSVNTEDVALRWEMYILAMAEKLD